MIRNSVSAVTDDHQHGIDRRALLGPDHEQRRDQPDDQHCREIDQTARFATLEEAPLDLRSHLQGMRQVNPD